MFNTLFTIIVYCLYQTYNCKYQDSLVEYCRIINLYDIEALFLPINETHCLLLPTRLHPEQLDLWELCGAAYISLIIYTIYIYYILILIEKCKL